MTIDYDTERFKLPEVARASGWAVPTLKSYFRRGLFSIRGASRGLDDAGLPSLFSLREVVMLAIVNRAWQAGFSPVQAFQAGSQFVNTSDMLEGEPHRDPAHMFTEGNTAMVLHPVTGAFEFIALSEDRIALTYHTLFVNPQFGVTDTVAIIMLSQVEHAVFTELRLDWREHKQAEQMLSSAKALAAGRK